MKITILTQSDPFFLAENINYLLDKLPAHSKVVSAVLFDVSPFGKQESFFQKIQRTIKIFGWKFFLKYSLIFIVNKFNNAKSVKHVLKRHSISIILLDKSINHPDSLAKIKKYNPDLLISIAGNQIFKKPLLDLAPNGCLNLHTALLPKYRGLMPTFWVLKNDEKETGVSVFFVDESIDSGPIIVQKKIKIKKDISQQQLIKETKHLGMDAILKSIDLIHNGKFKLISNDNREKTYYSFPTRKDVELFYKKGKKFF